MGLYYARRGSGEPLLLIQGVSGNHTHWGEPLLSRLEQDFDVVAFDNRGMGRSPSVTNPFTIRDLAGDALAVMDAVGWERAHVLGISMGGMIAQELVLSAPKRVVTLALGCTYCGGAGSLVADPAVLALLMEAMQSGDRDRALRAGFSVNVSAAYAADEANFGRFREIALALPAPPAVTMLQLQAISGHDTSSRLPDIATPTLVMHGDADQILPVANGRMVAALIADARLEVFAGAGHLFWWEDPERAAHLVREHALAHASATHSDR